MRAAATRSAARPSWPASAEGARLTLLLANAAATLAMAGIIWFVQIVHYPLMARAGEAGFARLAAEHQRLTGRVVAAPMLVEALTAVALALWPPDGVPRAATLAGLALVGVLWASTALLQVPRHRELACGFDPVAHRRLVAGNWVRTIAWSARAALVVGMLAGAA